MAEGQVGVGLAELYHPLLVFTELDAVVVEVPVDVALKFVDELLLGKTVNALRHKGLVVAHGSHHAVGEGKAIVGHTKLTRGTTHEPALLDHLLNLLGVGHHLQARDVKVVAQLLPRESFASLNHGSQDHNLNVGKAQLLAEVGEGGLHRLPELIVEPRVLRLVEYTVQGRNNGPGLWLLVLALLFAWECVMTQAVFKLETVSLFLNF